VVVELVVVELVVWGGGFRVANGVPAGGSRWPAVSPTGWSVVCGSAVNSRLSAPRAWPACSPAVHGPAVAGPSVFRPGGDRVVVPGLSACARSRVRTSRLPNPYFPVGDPPWPRCPTAVPGPRCLFPTP